MSLSRLSYCFHFRGLNNVGFLYRGARILSDLRVAPVNLHLLLRAQEIWYPGPYAVSMMRLNTSSPATYWHLTGAARRAAEVQAKADLNPIPLKTHKAEFKPINPKGHWRETSDQEAQLNYGGLSPSALGDCLQQSSGQGTEKAKARLSEYPLWGTLSLGGSFLMA